MNREEVFVKIQKKKIFIFWGVGSGGGGRVGGQGRCEQRSENSKKNWGVRSGGGGFGGSGRGKGVGGGGVRVDANEELKFFVKIQKNGGRSGGGRVGGGVSLDVNEELKFL